MRNPNLARTLAFRAAQPSTPAYAKAVEERDYNSCTVVALQHLTGCAYMEAFQALKSIGRGMRSGLSYYDIPAYLELFRARGFTVERVSTWDRTNNFLVIQTTHAAAIMGGVPVNGLTPGSPIMSVWKVERRG